MSSNNMLSLRDIDLRAQRVLESVKFLNLIIILGVESVIKFFSSKRFELPTQKVSDFELDHITSSEEYSPTEWKTPHAIISGDNIKTGNTSYTLNGSELQKLVDEKIETKVYKDEGRGIKDETCKICEKKFNARDKIKILSKCQHYYHAKCLTEKIKANQRVCIQCGDDFTGLLVHSYDVPVVSSPAPEQADAISMKTTRTRKSLLINTPGTTDFYTNYYPTLADSTDAEFDEKATL